MNTFSLIIGLERYQAQPIPINPVAYAEADAKALANALEAIGIPTANIALLLSAQATKATIESRLKTAISGLTKSDSFIFFFAGHGLSLNDENYLTCHDTQRGDLPATSISLKWIFQELKKSKCKHVTFLLDSCHSGLPIDEAMRGIADHISDAEFQATFKDSEYQVAFASCKTDEFSYSAITLSHGIWTYHVLRALSGEETAALERGRFLTSNSLQNYLYVEVPRTLRKTRTDHARQTPCIFGNATSDFIIADLKPLIDARQAALSAKVVAPKNAAFVGLQQGSIRSLSGFKKYHKVPTNVDQATRRFVGNICDTEARDQANAVHTALRKNLGYGVKDIDSGQSGSSAWLKTKDFDVDIHVAQSEEDPGDYIIRTEIGNFRTPAVVATDTFNSAVARFVDTLELGLPPKFDLKEMIAKLEENTTRAAVRIDYDTDLSNVEIEFRDTGVILKFSGGLCGVTSNKGSTPLELLEAVTESQGILFASGAAKTPLLRA